MVQPLPLIKSLNTSPKENISLISNANKNFNNNRWWDLVETDIQTRDNNLEIQKNLLKIYLI